MCRLTAALLCGPVFFASIVSAPAQETAALKALVKKAIKAHGGADKLNKAEVSHTKLSGTLDFMGGIKFTSENYVQPGKFKLLVEITVNNQNINVVQVYDGKTFWVNVGGKTMELKDPDILKGIRENKYSERIGRVVGLLDKGIELSPLGEIKVNDKDAVGVRASSKGHKDVNLYFDKKSHLLLKTEARSFDPLSKQEKTMETIISEYHKVDGIQTPRRMVINSDGKRYLTLEISSIEFADRYDDSMFERP